jgi:AcrB/AcrD/AcrF family
VSPAGGVQLSPRNGASLGTDVFPVRDATPPHRAMLAVVLAGAMITYGGVSLFVAFFVLAPMAQSLFQAADIPHQLMPAAIVLGTSTFTMSAIAGNAGHSERDSHAVLRDYAVRGARPWHHRVACHADLRVAPLGLIGVVAALLLSGRPLGFVAILGILALFGMITKNAVILIGQIGAEREHGKTVWQAAIDASSSRFRPIMLTAVSTVLGMIPIAPTVFWGPMAFAIMGGLLVGTVLTLVFLPTLYVAWFRDRASERQADEESCLATKATPT